jgi:hypothetical protein
MPISEGGFPSGTVAGFGCAYPGVGMVHTRAFPNPGDRYVHWVTEGTSGHASLDCRPIAPNAVERASSHRGRHIRVAPAVHPGERGLGVGDRRRVWGRVGTWARADIRRPGRNGS